MTALGYRHPTEVTPEDLAHRRAVRDRLRTVRARRGITGQQMADRSGVRRRTIDDFDDRADCNTRIGTWTAYANALGYSLTLHPRDVPGYPRVDDGWVLAGIGGDAYQHRIVQQRLSTVRLRDRGVTARAEERIDVGRGWFHRAEYRDPSVMGMATMQRVVYALGGRLEIRVELAGAA